MTALEAECKCAPAKVAYKECPLSNPRGILIFDWADEVDAHARRALETMGIGVSTFGEPGSEEKFEIEGYKEMFIDWGWTGPDDEKPQWFA